MDDIIRDLQSIRSRTRDLVGGITEDLLIRRPDPTKWSIAECLTHLNLTARLVQGLIANAIEHGRREKITGDGPFSPGPKGRLLVWIAEPPPKFRMRAPKPVAIVAVENPTMVVPEFMRMQDEWERLWNEARGLDLSRIKVGPRFSPFRCRLSGCFPWMMAHQRRHILQAENVKKQLASRAATA